MALFRNNPSGGIMDVIRCDEKNYLVWKWHPQNSEEGAARENAIRWGSPLRVREGSVAVVVYTGKEGFVQDIIEGPADVVLDTKNLPVISNLVGMAYNGGTPFQAEVYFINGAETIPLKFAVPYFDVADDDEEMMHFPVPVAVRGNFEFNISDYAQFIKVHTLDRFSPSELQDLVRNAMIETVQSVVANAPATYGVPVIQLNRKISEIKAEVLKRVKSKFYESYGVNLKDINIQAVEINKEDPAYKEYVGNTKDIISAKRKSRAVREIKNDNREMTLGFIGKAADMFASKKDAAADKELDRKAREIEIGDASADRKADRIVGAIGKLKDIREEQRVQHLKAESEFAAAAENIRAGRVGAAGAKIIGAFAKKEAASKRNGAPPPVPVTSFYVVLYGQQSGPFDMPTLMKMVSDGSVTPESLVWQEGMDEWVEAKTVQKLAALFE